MKEIDRLKQQLKSVRKGIEDIETDSQSFDIESNGSRRSAKKAELATLYRREGDLAVKIKRLTRRGLQTLRFED